MGDIKKQKKMYAKPFHPWQKDRIVAEKELMTTFGLQNKKELWRVGSKLSTFKDRIKFLTVREGPQETLEKKQLEDKLISLGLLKAGDPLDSVLATDVNVLLERRLQTLVLRKGLARTISQARQFIIHGHVVVGSKVMTVPGYLVKLSEESGIAFTTSSSLYDIEHPERVQAPKEVKVEKVEEKEKKKGKKKEISEVEKKILTEEEIEAKEIENVLGSEEDQEIAKLEKETPDVEVKEIIADGKTELEKLKK